MKQTSQDKLAPKFENNEVSANGDTEIIIIEGMNHCILGYDYPFSPYRPMRAVYSLSGILKQLVKEGYSEKEALEYVDNQLKGEWSGLGAPIIVSD